VGDRLGKKGMAEHKKGRLDFGLPAGRSLLGRRSSLGLGLAETLNAISFLPLAALLENRDALKALHDVALHDDTGGTLEAFVLRHGLKM